MKCIRRRCYDSGLEELELIQRDTEQLRELAQRYKAARSDREARKISRDMAKLSKELGAARRAIEEIEKAQRTAGY